MTTTSCRSLFIGGLFFLAAAPAAAQEGIFTGQCNVPKMKFIVNETGSTTTSTTFQNVSGASVSFEQGGSRAGCVVVRFSAQAFAPDSNILYLRAQIDAKIGHPTVVMLTADDGSLGKARAYDFVFPSVAPGTHVLRMQFRAQSGAASVALFKTNTIVQYQ